MYQNVSNIRPDVRSECAKCWRFRTLKKEEMLKHLAASIHSRLDSFLRFLLLLLLPWRPFVISIKPALSDTNNKPNRTIVVRYIRSAGCLFACLIWRWPDTYRLFLWGVKQWWAKPATITCIQNRLCFCTPGVRCVCKTTCTWTSNWVRALLTPARSPN